MKKIVLNPIFAVLIVNLIFNVSLSQVSTAEEKWEANMKKDFTKVLREKKRPAEKHRELIAKWQEQG
ncbi:hypothetical protein F4Y93_06850, partial [Candidatus Poribacteria bacterium]|nr:hypothetical protein [Candidatus Poribacteria bacterium]